MKITNKFGLPKTIVNAVERDPYTKGHARISATGLLKPPRIGLLYQKHQNKIEKDVTDSVWSIFGRAVHTILEAGGDEEHIPEERLYAEVRGWVISGQLDVQKLDEHRIKIIDYKTCAAYSVMNDKPEWENQLNLYRWLVEVAKDYEVQSLHICAFVRDWNKHKARENINYPQSPAVMIDVPLWTWSKAQAFVEERVRIHQEAHALWDMAGEAPPCTDEERWMKETTYAVIKPGNKRPTKVFKSGTCATRLAEQIGAKVQIRKGEPIRCTGDYCNVSAWCDQYQKWREENG